MTDRQYYPVESMGYQGKALLMEHPNRRDGLAFYMNSRTFREAIIDLRMKDGLYVINVGYGRLGRFGPDVYLGPDNTPVYSRRTVPAGMFEIDLR